MDLLIKGRFYEGYSDPLPGLSFSNLVGDFSYDLDKDKLEITSLKGGLTDATGHEYDLLSHHFLYQDSENSLCEFDLLLQDDYKDKIHLKGEAFQDSLLGDIEVSLQGANNHIGDIHFPKGKVLFSKDYHHLI